MPFEVVETGGNEVRVLLEGRIGVQQARLLWDALCPAAAAQKGIRVEAGAAEEVDTSIAQVLYRLSQKLDHFHIGSASEAFLASLRCRGLDGFFLRAAESDRPAPDPGRGTKPAPRRKAHSRKKGSSHG
jgi:hypothetical protein